MRDCVMSARSIPEAIRLHAQERPDNPALIVWSYDPKDHQTITYSQLALRMGAAARQLHGLLSDEEGTHDKRVAILSHNSPAYLVHSLACMSLRAIAIHLNWRQAPSTSQSFPRR